MLHTIATWVKMGVKTSGILKKKQNVKEENYMNTERKLASIRKVSSIQPIEGADAIEIAVVDGWKVVTKKGEYTPGSLCIYCEIDSFLPIKEEFEFLRKSSYKKMGDQEGFRLRTIKLRGQVSQGLLLPLTTFQSFGHRLSPNLLNENYAIEPDRVAVSPSDMIELSEGSDVTDVLGIVKYEPPIPAELAGKVKGNFPSFLRKTDEERVQNITKEYGEYCYQSKHQFYVTEKLDGSSSTFYFNNGEFGVCSRNLELLETEGNTFWKVARELDLENKLRNYGINVSLQGELIGEGIQGNPYKLKGQTVKFFNAFDIDKQERMSLGGFLKIMDDLDLDFVPFLDMNFLLPRSIDGMLEYAEGRSKLNYETEREGVVVRSMDTKISFKAISNKFLLDEK
jgi:RNA ligase (TIGR02306 family)